MQSCGPVRPQTSLILLCFNHPVPVHWLSLVDNKLQVLWIPLCINCFSWVSVQGNKTGNIQTQPFSDCFSSWLNQMTDSACSVCALSQPNICIPVAHIYPPFSSRKKEMGDFTQIVEYHPHAPPVSLMPLPSSNLRMLFLSDSRSCHTVTRGMCDIRLFECCPTCNVGVSCQRITDEGHVGARSGVDHGIHASGM